MLELRRSDGMRWLNPPVAADVSGAATKFRSKSGLSVEIDTQNSKDSACLPISS